MGYFYPKAVGDKTLVLSARQGLSRVPNFSPDWTEARIAMFYSGITAADYNTTAIAETVAYSGRQDYISFGLKNSDDPALPGLADSLFLGATNQVGANSVSNTVGFYSSTSGTLSAAGFVGTTLVGGTGSEALAGSDSGLQYPAANGASSYCGFYALKFVIADRGLVTQTVAISAAVTSPMTGTDFSETALLTKMTSATFGTVRTLDWNDGVVAYDIPDAFWIRLPFFNNRIRISAMRAITTA